MPKDNTKPRRQYYVWKIECQNCGNVFSSSRQHAKTCSPRCRKALSRKDPDYIEPRDREKPANKAIEDLMRYVSPSAQDSMKEILGWLINPDDKREFVYQIREVVRVEEQ